MNSSFGLHMLSQLKAFMQKGHIGNCRLIFIFCRFEFWKISMIVHVNLKTVLGGGGGGGMSIG